VNHSITALLVAAAIALSASMALASPVPDSRQLEKELQSLDWGQFKAVIEATPEIRREVEKYGPLGWEYVKTNYRSHGWKKNIDRLDTGEKQHLAQLIQRARKLR
jgi:hypothetical protein